jgi:TonB dependent receptor.
MIEPEKLTGRKLGKPAGQACIRRPEKPRGDLTPNHLTPNHHHLLFDPLSAGQRSPTEGPRSPAIGTALNPYSVVNRGGRNGARGPDFFQSDVRIGYRIPLLAMHFELIAEVFNLFNRANFANPSGDRRLATVNINGVPTQAITNANYLNLTALHGRRSAHAAARDENVLLA